MAYLLGNKLTIDDSTDIISALTGLKVDGSADVVQLTVQGHSSQTANLQEWQNSSAGILLNVEPDGELVLPQDSKAFWLGAGKDMSIYYDGTSGYIKADEVAASDLHITTGAAKTMVLDTSVYNDANVGSLVLVTGGTLPGVVELLESDGGSSGIYMRGFAVGEQGSGSIEIPHDYKEGSNIVFHIHWTGQDAPTGTDNVRWQLTYSVTRGGVVTPSTTTVVAADDTAFDTQYMWMLTNVATITGTNFKIGDQFNFTVTRIAASGDAYAGEAIVATMGFHYECDTLGSRQIGTK